MVVALSCRSFGSDELSCEEALSRIQDCCPGFNVDRIDCAQGCRYNNPSSPDLTERASECIRDRDCGELQSRGICEGLIRISREPYPSLFPNGIEDEACK